MEEKQLLREQINNLHERMLLLVDKPEVHLHKYVRDFFDDILENIEALPEAKELRRHLGKD